MAVKIAVTREYEDEKRHVHSNRLLLFLLQKKLTALSDIFFSFWRLCTGLMFAKIKRIPSDRETSSFRAFTCGPLKYPAESHLLNPYKPSVLA